MSATIALSNYSSPHAPTQPHSVGAPRFQPQANNSSIARSPAPLARVQTSQKPALPSSQAVAKPLPGLCSHSSDLSREDLTKTFATVALWSKQLQQDAISPPTKKRKVRLYSFCSVLAEVTCSSTRNNAQSVARCSDVLLYVCRKVARWLSAVPVMLKHIARARIILFHST